MRWLVDECVAPELAAWLRSEGHDVVYALETFRSATDAFIFDLAVREQRILLTEDADFGERIFRWASGLTIPGVVHIRIASERKALKLARLSEVVTAHGDRLADHYVVISDGRSRFRMIPRR